VAFSAVDKRSNKLLTVMVSASSSIISSMTSTPFADGCHAALVHACMHVAAAAAVVYSGAAAVVRHPNLCTCPC
jgi:hypothetical protein